MARAPVNPSFGSILSWEQESEEADADLQQETQSRRKGRQRWEHRNPVCLEQEPPTPARVAPLGGEEP